MSKNRENRIWQSPDGTWNRGFFAFVVTGPDDEWDVEYDYERFFWVSTRHATEERAHESWDGSNPGGYQRVVFNETNRAEIERLDRLARECRGKSRRG